ncbi:MAG: hypothetical protein HRU70_10620 [Phycisphaeraceae bacterium]|nr:MAG: hypothetical protein HRU70_10620 [Phycisphaeraceae bacterium]
MGLRRRVERLERGGRFAARPAGCACGGVAMLEVLAPRAVRDLRSITAEAEPEGGACACGRRRVIRVLPPPRAWAGP